MNPFEKRRLGSSSAMVPCLGMGCGTLGDPWERISDQQAQKTVQAAYDAGVRYFDTAPWYGIGLSEHRTGAALRGHPRDSFFLSTKVGRVLHRPSRPGPAAPWAARWKGALPFELRFDYTRDGVLRSYEDSLQRLGTDRVDSLVIHDLDLKFHQTQEGVRARLGELDQGGGFRTLQELKASGHIAAVGAGINHMGMIPLFLDRFDLDFFLVAMPYTLLDQESLDGEFPLCLERGASVVIGTPFASGLLASGTVDPAFYAHGPASEAILAKTGRIESICRRHDVPLAAAALQFPLAHPVVASVIPGLNSTQQVHDAVANVRHSIRADFWAELRHEHLIDPRAPIPQIP